MKDYRWTKGCAEWQPRRGKRSNNHAWQKLVCWTLHASPCDSSIPSDLPALVHSLKDCNEDVSEWESDSMLKMNNDKTELTAIGTKSKISQVTPQFYSCVYLWLWHTILSVCNLGVFVDETLSMDVHIKHLCRILFSQLRRLVLSTDTANKLAVPFILTRLYYGNSLLADLPYNKLNTLQHIQNHAARIVLRKPRHVECNITA